MWLAVHHTCPLAGSWALTSTCSDCLQSTTTETGTLESTRDTRSDFLHSYYRLYAGNNRKAGLAVRAARPRVHRRAPASQPGCAAHARVDDVLSLRTSSGASTAPSVAIAGTYSPPSSGRTGVSSSATWPPSLRATRPLTESTCRTRSGTSLATVAAVAGRRCFHRRGCARSSLRSQIHRSRSRRRRSSRYDAH